MCSIRKHGDKMLAQRWKWVKEERRKRDYAISKLAQAKETTKSGL